MDFGTSNMLNFHYQKSIDEVKSACAEKVIKLAQKIEERRKRISDLRQLHEIDDSALIQLLTAARKQQNQGYYTFTPSVGLGNSMIQAKQPDQRDTVEKTVGAGVVQNLLTEQDAIEQETDSMRKLNMIQRNLRPTQSWNAETGEFYSTDFVSLNPQELSFLGF